MEEHAVYAFILGLAYATIGIGTAVILFPQDPAIVAVALTALLFYPTLRKLVRAEELEESKNATFNMFKFFRQHHFIFKIYILFFIGSLIAFAFFTITLPSLATNHIFENQLSIIYPQITGNAVGLNTGLFQHLFSNNISVLGLIFLTAFLLGDGGLFLLVWNASVWGTIFGTFAKNYAAATATNPALAFFTVIGIVLLHTVLEALAYIFAAASGGIISRGITSEKLFSQRFNHVIIGTLIILAVSVIILVIAVGVETLVLDNITFYADIVRHSFS